MAMKLARECAYFDAFHDEIVKGHLGEFVVIKGNEVMGYYKGPYDGCGAMAKRGFGPGTFATYPCTEQFPSMQVWSPGVVSLDYGAGEAEGIPC